MMRTSATAGALTATTLIVCLTTPLPAQTFLSKDAGAWSQELSASDEARRRSAAFALGKLGSHAREALPALKRKLQEEKEAEVREAIAFALGEIAKEARENGIGATSAKYLAGARIVRAFNTLNYRRLASASNRAEGRIGIPMAGDDKDALAIASALVRDAGFDPVIIGPLERAKDFAQGAPLYGQEISAQEMQQRAKSLR